MCTYLLHSLCTYPLYIEQVQHEIESAVCVIVQRGLLRKGLGLCHGIAGNLYPLLEAHTHTHTHTLGIQDTIHNFILCILNHHTLHTHGILGVGDAEYSLFEGQAGALVCMVDHIQGMRGIMCEGFPFFSDC
ncbi:hypothetical protein EON63_01265 [archaeon]|nr:MAG: hypothetical protein EON63_01265 [archaeon]